MVGISSALGFIGGFYAGLFLATSDFRVHGPLLPMVSLATLGMGTMVSVALVMLVAPDVQRYRSAVVLASLVAGALATVIFMVARVYPVYLLAVPFVVGLVVTLAGSWATTRSSQPS